MAAAVTPAIRTPAHLITLKTHMAVSELRTGNSSRLLNTAVTVKAETAG